MEDQIALKNVLLELELQLLKPHVRKAPGEIDQLLADKFFEFGSSGTIWYKKDFVGGQGISVRDMILTNFQFYPLADDVVLVTYHIKDVSRKQNTLRSSIWKFIEGRWQMFFHQGTITES